MAGLFHDFDDAVEVYAVAAVGKGGVEKSCHLCTTFLVVPYKKQHLIYSLILYIIYSYFKPEEVGFTNI